MNGDALPTALRAFAERHNATPRRSPRPIRKRPDVALVFDTETTVDAAQRLTFGSYRFLQLLSDGRANCVDEGLFYADDLPKRNPEGFALLQEYARTHRADATSASGRRPPLRLLSRRQFVDRV